MSLTDFLLARIADDEEAVNERTLRLAPGGWAYLEQFGDFGDDERWMIEVPAARLLAECDAKRRIVEAEARWRRTKDNVTATSRKAPDDWVDVTWMDENFRPHEEHVSQEEFNERFTEPAPPSETLRLLALPYADHVDYDQAWRPSSC